MRIALLDLLAAFEMINQSVLLERLQHRFGIQDDVLKWFKSYLTDPASVCTIWRF